MMRRVVSVFLGTALLVQLSVAPFSCPGSEQGCANDQICCNDDSKCYDIATGFEACKFSCTALTEDAANLPCFDSKSRKDKCFGKTCSGNGDCFEGECHCNIGFTGADCEKVACLNDCHDHGKCESGICQCHPGYTGIDCRTKVCPDGCSGHGQCKKDPVTNLPGCSCTTEWEGAGCAEPGCPTNKDDMKCSGHGECITDGQPHNYDRRWKCKCVSGFVGDDCGSPECPLHCSGRGECREGVCICKVGFGGEGCEFKNECGPSCERFSRKYGKCNTETLKCDCADGWEGFDCLYPKEKPCLSGSNGVNCGTADEATECMNDCTSPQHGTCVEGSCRCKPGHFGPDCGVKSCPNDCNGENGKCDETTGECKCAKNYIGIDCGKPACPNGCNGNGVCDENSRCICHPPFFGEDCGKRACAIGKKGQECSGVGRCGENGRCECPTGRTGHTCSREYCLNDCSGHGMCVQAKCYCDDLWEGADCGEKSCPNDCSERGVCTKKTGKCTCNEGYFGAGCENTVCGVDCGINGHCDSKTRKCVCVDGFGGIGCQTASKTPASPKKAAADSVRFKRVQAKASLSSCATGCASSCGEKAAALSKSVDVASFSTSCNIDCTKKCMGQ